LLLVAVEVELDMEVVVELVVLENLILYLHLDVHP
jgi:hypothetical protein